MRFVGFPFGFARAGLLTYSDDDAFPTLMVSGKDLSSSQPHVVERNLQQRELLQTFTAFPFNRAGCKTLCEPLRWQI